VLFAEHAKLSTGVNAKDANWVTIKEREIFPKRSAR